jgi:GNAT superfamily N-acetyltransferase
MNIQIKAYKNNKDIADNEAVVALLEKQMDFISSGQKQSSVASSLSNAMKDESRSVLWVAYQEEKAIGFAFGNVCCGLESGGDYLWLNEIYVEKEVRMQNVGSLLIEAVQTWAKQSNCTYLAMITHPQNVGAQHLFKKAGFELESLVWVDKSL